MLGEIHRDEKLYISIFKHGDVTSIFCGCYKNMFYTCLFCKYWNYFGGVVFGRCWPTSRWTMVCRESRAMQGNYYPQGSFFVCFGWRSAITQPETWFQTYIYMFTFGELPNYFWNIMLFKTITIPPTPAFTSLITKNGVWQGFEAMKSVIL